MTKTLGLAAAGTALLLAGCATTPRPSPVEVSRYHLGQPMERTSVAVQPISGIDSASPEYQLYLDAVAAELARLGYAPAANGDANGYVAAVGFTRASRGSFRDRPPVSIGLGGGSYGGGGIGLGGGLSFGIGGKRREVIASELTVQLRRRSDNTVVWEGRALTDSVSGKPGSDPRDSAERLARALFRDFPGESGITTTVP